MKKLLLLFVLTSLASCSVRKISDAPITVQSQYKLARPYYYKYIYKCHQNSIKLNIYSNEEYKEGQILNIK